MSELFIPIAYLTSDKTYLLCHYKNLQYTSNFIVNNNNFMERRCTSVLEREDSANVSYYVIANFYPPLLATADFANLTILSLVPNYSAQTHSFVLSYDPLAIYITPSILFIFLAISINSSALIKSNQIDRYLSLYVYSNPPNPHAHPLSHALKHYQLISHANHN